MMPLRLFASVIAILLFATAFPMSSEAAQRSCVNVFDGSLFNFERELGEVASRAHEPKIFRKNFIIGSEAESARKAVLSVAPEDRPRKALEEYMNLRLRHLPKKLRALARATIDSRSDMIRENVMIGGATLRTSDAPKYPRLEALLGKHATFGVDIYVNEKLEGSALHYAAVAHELEHVIQYLSVFGFHKYTKKLNVRTIYLLEFGAVRAEWEYFKLLPNEDIQTTIARVREFENLASSPSALAVVRKTASFVENAHNSFERFHDLAGYATEAEVRMAYGIFQ